MALSFEPANQCDRCGKYVANPKCLKWNTDYIPEYHPMCDSCFDYALAHQSYQRYDYEPIDN